MSLPKSLLAYQPQLDFMERAMDEVRGCRMFFNTEPEAEHFRSRVHYARVLHREENKKIHEVGAQLHGKSEFDILVMTIRHSPDGVWVYAEKAVLDESRVEPIPEDDYAPSIDAGQIMEGSDDNEVAS